MASDNPESIEDRAVTLQAGLRTLHEKGPELKRAISGQLDEMLEQVLKSLSIIREQNISFLISKEADRENDVEPTHRRNLPLFGNMMSSFKRRGSPNIPSFNSAQQPNISTQDSVEYAAQSPFRRIPDE